MYFSDDFMYVPPTIKTELSSSVFDVQQRYVTLGKYPQWDVRGEKILSSMKGSIAVRDTNSFEITSLVKVEDFIPEFYTVSPDGRYLLVVNTKESKCGVWDINQATKVCNIHEENLGLANGKAERFVMFSCVDKLTSISRKRYDFFWSYFVFSPSILGA